MSNLEDPLLEKAKQPQFTGSVRVYSFAVLAVLFLAYLSNQVDRSILYYTKSNIQADLGVSASQYGLLAGYGFSLIFVISGIPLGRLVDTYPRKYLLLAGVLLWNAMTLTSGISHNFWQLLLSRLGLGVGQAICNPAAFGLLADYFPPAWRPVANSLYNIGIYAGGGLSSYLGGVATHSSSWSTVYIWLALAGFAVAALLLFFVREPKRGQFAQDDPSSASSSKVANASSGAAKPTTKYTITQTAQYLMNLQSAWIVALAGGIRSLGGYAFGGFVYNYLDLTYNLEHQRSMISTYYGIVTALGGFSASLLGGWLTKWWITSQPRAPALVPALGALLAIPFVGLFIYADSIFGHASDGAYALVLVCVFFAYLTAEVWGGPAASIYQTVFPSAMQGSAFAIYFFVLTLIGGGGPELIGLVKPTSFVRDGKSVSAANRHMLFFTIAGSYALCAVAFIYSSYFIAGDVKRKEEFEETNQLPAVTSERKWSYILATVVMVAFAVALMALSFA